MTASTHVPRPRATTASAPARRRALFGALLVGLVLLVGWPAGADASPQLPSAPGSPAQPSPPPTIGPPGSPVEPPPPTGPPVTVNPNPTPVPVPGAPPVPPGTSPPPSAGECTWDDYLQLVRDGEERKVETFLFVDCPPGVPEPGSDRDGYPPFPAEHAGCELAPTGSGRNASYRGECGTQTWAERNWPEDYHPCSWRMQTGDDQSRTVTLECPSNVYTPTQRDLMPPPPTGCRWEDGYVPPGQAARPTCGDVGQQEVDCRNEASGPWIIPWPDDHKTLQVPENAPKWWLDEIEAESSVDKGQGCKLAEHPPYLPCADRDLEKYAAPGLLPDGCWGTYPTSNYELSWDDGSATDVSKMGERLLGWVASFMFVVGRSSIQVVLWMVQWGFEFDITDYGEDIVSVGGAYDKDIVGLWGVEDLVWMVLIGYAAMATLRRRFTAAGGELLVSFVMLGLATVMFTNREVYMDAVSEAMTKGSDELLVAAVDAPPGQVADQRRDVIRPLQEDIHDQFVEEPYMYLNWGASNMPASCRAIVLNIAATGWDGDGWPARYMGRDGNDATCQALSSSNAEMNGTRLASAMLTMGVSLVVSAVLGLAAVTVLLAKFMVGVLAALAAFVPVIAVLPGSGRRLAWVWVGAGVQAFAAAWGMSFVIAMMLIATRTFLEGSEEMEIYERWGLMLIVVAIAYLGRKRVVASTQTFAGYVADAMTRVSPASANWAGGKPVGVDYGRADKVLGRSAQIGGIVAAAPAVFAGRSMSQRWQERRAARRSLRNMRYMERQRLRPQFEYRADTYQYSRRADPGKPAKVALAVGGKKGNKGNKGKGRATARYRAASGGGVQDGEMRERWEMVAKVQTPPPFLRNPIRNLQDRVSNRGIMRSARRQAAHLRDAPYAPDRFVAHKGMPHVKGRPTKLGKKAAPPVAKRPTWRQKTAKLPRRWT